MTQLLDHDQLRARDLIGESVGVSWREGGILGPVDDQGGYLDVWQPTAPAWGAVDRNGMVEAVAEDVGRPADCCTAISRLPASSKGYVP